MMLAKSHKLTDISIFLLILVLTGLIVVAVQQAFFKSTYVGYLSTSNCLIPEGCGPTYKLYALDKESYIPLLGDFEDTDTYAVIKVRGKQVVLPKSEYHAMNYTGPTMAVQASSYEVLDEASYLDLFW